MTLIRRVLGPGKLFLPNQGRWRSCMIVECICGRLNAIWSGLHSKHKRCLCPPNERTTVWGIERQCKCCKEWLMLNQFYKQPSGHRERRSICPTCLLLKRDQNERL